MRFQLTSCHNAVVQFNTSDVQALSAFLQGVYDSAAALSPPCTAALCLFLSSRYRTTIVRVDFPGGYGWTAALICVRTRVCLD